LDNFKTVILQAIGEGTDICVAMDSNKALDTKNQHFQEWIAECSLISMHASMYDEEYYKANKIPTTHRAAPAKLTTSFVLPICLGASLEWQSNHYMTVFSLTIGH
jgi:hypothetical protein